MPQLRKNGGMGRSTSSNTTDQLGIEKLRIDNFPLLIIN